MHAGRRMSESTSSSFLPGLGQNHGQIQRGEALAFLHHGAGDQDHLRRSAG